MSALYSEFLEGGYDCVDRVVLNAYFSMGQTGGGFRMWWRELNGSDENLDDNHLMRMAGRFSRRLRAWAKANGIPVIYCSPADDKHKMGEQHLATHDVKSGLCPASTTLSNRVASIKYVTEQLIVVGRRLQDASDFFRRQLIRLHTIW